MSIEGPNNSPTGQAGPASDLKDRAGSDLGNITDTAKHDLDAIAQKAKEDVGELGQHASEKVAEATEKAKSFAGDQKDLAAGQINGVAAAINKVADELDGSEQPTVARYARDLASGLSGIGKTIEDRDVDDLMGLAQDFGRKQPVAFLGAAALAGFVASRFALASAHRRDSKPSKTSAYQAENNPAYAGNASEPNRSGGQ